MKLGQIIKFFTASFLFALLAACVSSAGSNSESGNIVSKAVLAPILRSECHSQLNKQDLWKIAKLRFPADKANEYENRICSCAADEAAARISPSQMLQLADESQRLVLAKEVIPPTLLACYQKLVK